MPILHPSSHLFLPPVDGGGVFKLHRRHRLFRLEIFLLSSCFYDWKNSWRSPECLFSSVPLVIQKRDPIQWWNIAGWKVRLTQLDGRYQICELGAIGNPSMYEWSMKSYQERASTTWKCDDSNQEENDPLCFHYNDIYALIFYCSLYYRKVLFTFLQILYLNLSHHYSCKASMVRAWSVCLVKWWLTLNLHTRFRYLAPPRQSSFLIFIPNLPPKI